MHIVVCIKQVPDSAQIRVHPVTNTIMRQGVPAIVNPYDLFALEEALRLKDQFGGRVTMLCMGPPQAEDALRKCISFGATDAMLVTDRAFAGADTLATSATRWPRRSARSARSRRSTWSSPASRPSTATPRRSAPASPSGWAEPADLRQQDRRGRPRRHAGSSVERRAEGGVQLLRPRCPPDHHARRHQRDALRQHGRHAARRPRPVRKWNKDDAGIEDVSKIGLKGSPTIVSKVFGPRARTSGRDAGDGRQRSPAGLPEPAAEDLHHAPADSHGAGGAPLGLKENAP
jgi:electron transfer flavoprotein beta subunit